MASGGSSGRASSGPRSFDFGADDVLCSYDDFSNQDPSNNGKRSDPSAKDFHEGRVGRPLVSVYGQQDEYSKEEIITAVEKCMKKYADNLLRHLDGISGRLSQLEIYCYKLEHSIGEFRADMIRDQSEAGTKLQSLEKHLQEVHRSIQILRDKQELAETQKELTKLQIAPTDSATATLSQKHEDAISEPKHHDDIPNTHLALALPHQIPPPPPASLPSRAPDHNQPPQPAPASLGVNPHDPRYVINQPIPYYPHQTQALQPELHYMQPKPQIQEPSIPAPPLPQQPQVLNQPQPPAHSFPQYQQQQWPQQVVAPTQQPASQPQPVRPHTPPTYPSYSRQSSATSETYGYSTVPQPNMNRPEPMPFGYGAASGSNVNMSSQVPPAKTGGYASNVPYMSQSNSVQGYNTAVYQQGYQPPSNSGGFHHQMMRSHPYAEMIEKGVAMGYPREHIVAVVNRMTESGQPVDLNTLLDSLSSRAATGRPPRAWSG